MAFDESLAERIRHLTSDLATLQERKMFGGLCFTISGNMCFGIIGEDLMVRVGPDAWARCLSLPHAREMDFNGRSMKGMVFVSPLGTSRNPSLNRWLERGLDFAGSLPPK